MALFSRSFGWTAVLSADIHVISICSLNRIMNVICIAARDSLTNDEVPKYHDVRLFSVFPPPFALMSHRAEERCNIVTLQLTWFVSQQSARLPGGIYASLRTVHYVVFLRL